jgi:hypothetical protein
MILSGSAGGVCRCPIDDCCVLAVPDTVHMTAANKLVAPDARFEQIPAES